MKLHLGDNVYKARLRFSPRFQSWVVAVGPVLMSREGLENQGATLHADSPAEEQQIIAAGLASKAA